MVHTKNIQINEFYRLKIEELLSRYNQVSAFVKQHNPSLGLVREYILREFLESILPQKARVCQGFVAYNGEISHQCDIIIYDCINYAPLYVFGDLSVISSEAVFAVIEVKSSINKERFANVLRSFEKLDYLRIENKFLFIYQNTRITTIRTYFHHYYLSQLPNEKQQEIRNLGFIVGNTFDVGDYHSFPNAIVSLEADYYLRKDYVSIDENDYYGYNAYSITDNSDKQVACVQRFIEDLTQIITPSINEDSIPFFTNPSYEKEKEDDLKKMAIIGSVPICLM